MNLEKVQERIKHIREIANDAECAHSEEDKLHQDVLRDIADGVEHPEALAREALKTLEINFARWRA